ncbi:ABC transporter ATP-binding protein [Psychromicrobium lacuslunae]|uniref:ABC transporter ATP-binding protein n=1 Tax=Psychromicrobium lacuslunae TaxID=1618207 RepID=UPI0009E4A2C9|nr:ABC transporter ATP-binding protein [Psychromicrobium lacuslunae]
MLVAQQLRVKGRHYDLVPPLTIEAAVGSLTLAVGDLQPQRTALALTLSARMKPSDGLVSWGQSSKFKHLRRHSALIDSPTVNEPEPHLSVKDLVTEDLALIPRRYRGIRRASDWLTVNSFEDIADALVEELPAARRLELLCTLALANPEVDLLVVDSPDRRGPHPQNWLPQLQHRAQDEGRPLCIVATVAQVPEDWQGRVIRIENPTAKPEEPSSEGAREPASTLEAPEPVTGQLTATQYAAAEPPAIEENSPNQPLTAPLTPLHATDSSTAQHRATPAEASEKQPEEESQELR